MASTQPIPSLSPSDLERIRDVFAQGQTLQAYQIATAFAPLPSWTGPEARVLAGRMAIHLGAPRLCFLMHLRAWREDRSHPEASYYYCRTLLERRGPLAAWRFLRRRGDLEGAPPNLRADWLAMHASVLGRLRDFDAAEEWLARAEETCPGQPWTQIEQAALLQMEDRCEEALVAAQRSLELRPWYRPGVQSTAHILQMLGRDREALDLLTEATGRIESTLILHQLAALQTELEMHKDAQATYARFREVAVLMDKETREWLAARCSDAAYYLGQRAEAVTSAREAGGPLYTAFADQLAEPTFEPKRVMLDVGFIRQHQHTCVPATLAVIARYWKRPTDHLDVAAEICYDGTPDHRERAWAEEHGYVCREFRITWEAACALLDRGIPFTLTTVEPGNAHMQAIIGYDTARRSLSARDPGLRNYVEYHADGMLERYRTTGPRGHALVPVEEAHRLDGLTLPEEDFYDLLYQMQRALHCHDRDEAARIFDDLRTRAPEHRLTCHGRRILALYDADAAELLAGVDGLLALFPDDPLYLLSRLSCLRDLARRDERLELLRGACARPDAQPLFFRMLAQELLPDARAHGTAVRALRRAIRFRPYDEGNFSTLASLYWGQRRFEEALELYGFAACLGDKNEMLARDYFLAARHLRRTDETLRFLRNRLNRFGANSSQPAQTLYWALEAFERLPEAHAVLDEALELRPNDGELLLFAAQAHSQAGNFDRASERLQAAQGKAPRPQWLRAAATLARVRGELAEALALWRQVTEAEPMAVDAAGAMTQLLAETEGMSAAIAYLKDLCDRFPHHFPLHQLWSSWARNEGAAAQESVVRRIVAIHPDDAWARRELALVLADQRRLDEAFAELTIAQGLEPHSPSYHGVHGQLCERAGRTADARAAYREALRLAIDSDFAIGRLMETCDTLAERRESLAFIEAELVRQVNFGDGLLAYAQYARYTLAPDELLASLRQAHAARPDLWHAWSALASQLIQAKRGEEARDLARQATERFPLLSPLWIDLASACVACDDTEGEVAALRQAAQVRPGWVVPLRRLGETLLRLGNKEEARPLLEQCVARSPLDVASHGLLADLMWQADEKEAALERVQLALTIEPGYQWGWGALRAWCQDLGRPEEAIAFTRRLVERRPDEARSWMILAETLTGEETLEERLTALDRAAERNPHLPDIYDLKASLLASVGRHDEAEAACRAPAWNGQPPLTLRGRLAWLHAQRGRFRDAITAMKTALAEDPDYFWGWSNLIDWQREHGSPDDYREASENVLRLMPTRATSYGYRGEARLRQGDRAGAKEDFARGLEIDPAYGFAGMVLFDEQFADGELDAAEATLKTLKTHEVVDDFVLARELRLAAKRKQSTEALALLDRLAASTEASSWPLESGLESVAESLSVTDADAALRRALDQQTPSPHAARLWVRRWSASGNYDECLAPLKVVDPGSSVGKELLSQTLHALGRGRQTAGIRKCMEHHEATLRGDVRLWGAVGYALTCIEDYRRTAEWLGDYEERSELQPWMLINLVIALRACGDDASAARASRKALELPRDHTTGHHLVWLALDEALQGKAGAGLATLEEEDPTGFDNTHQFLWGLVDALALVQNEGPGAFAKARERLVEAVGECTPLTEDRIAVRRMYRLAVRRLARDVGTTAAGFWAMWRRLVPLLPGKVAS